MDQRENDRAFFKICKNRSKEINFCKKQTGFYKNYPKIFKKCSKKARFWHTFTFAPPFLAQKRRSHISACPQNVHKSL